jgi:enolase
MEKIIDIKARQVLDSRGNPTIEVDVFTENAVGSAMVPSGASTGIYEALELRDGGKDYNGKAVTKAVTHVNTAIKKALLGKDAFDQRAIDKTLLALDGTPDKVNLGANALLGVSMATARAAASAKEEPLFVYLSSLHGTTPVLPLPFANVINGGKHAAGKLEFQEFMIVPTGAKSFAEATQMVAETYHALAKILKERYGSGATHLGDEGGFAPPLDTPEQALDLLVAAIKAAGYTGRMKLALDPASSEFYDAKSQTYLRQKLKPRQLKTLYKRLMTKYPIISIEDGFEQDDVKAWQAFTKETRAKKAFQVVGDDLTVSNPSRIKRAIEGKWCDALLLKVNQIGTLTEAIDAALLARSAGWNIMVSHRSGETEDPFIADLATALGCGQIKLGAPARGERTAKYNQLIRIEEYLGKKATYAKYG